MYELEKGEAPSELAVDPAASPASTAKGGTSLAVLVVEDNRLNQQLVLALLSGWGHRVDAVNNGIEALRLHHEKPFDLILMDLHMPEMGGFEATARILERESRSVDKTPIIAMTASVMESERALCIAAGMADYLPKPFKVEMIAALLKKYFPAAATSSPAAAKKAPSKSAAHEAYAARMKADDGKFDYAGAIAQADAEVVRLIATLFLEQAPLHLRKMRWAWETGDYAVLQRHGDTIIGLLGSFLAEPACRIAAEIERSVRERKPLPSAELFDALEREVAQLMPHVAAIALLSKANNGS
jgi:CheY-like chemotaxis protein